MVPIIPAVILATSGASLALAGVSLMQRSYRVLKTGIQQEKAETEIKNLLDNLSEGEQAELKQLNEDATNLEQQFKDGLVTQDELDQKVRKLEVREVELLMKINPVWGEERKKLMETETA